MGETRTSDYGSCRLYFQTPSVSVIYTLASPEAYSGLGLGFQGNVGFRL